MYENTQVTCMHIYVFTDISAIAIASKLIGNCDHIRVFEQTAKHCDRLADVITSSLCTYVCNTFTPQIKGILVPQI